MIEFIDIIVWCYTCFASVIYVTVILSGFNPNTEDEKRKDVYIRKVTRPKGEAKPMLTKDNWKSKVIDNSCWHVPEPFDKETTQSFLQYLNFVSGISMFVLRNKPKSIQVYNFIQREDGKVRFSQCGCKDVNSPLDPDLLIMSPFVDIGDCKSNDNTTSSCWNEDYYTSTETMEQHKLTTMQNGQIYFDENKGCVHVLFGWFVFPRQKFAQKFASPKTAKKMQTKMEITLNDDDESLDWTMMAVVPEGDDKGKTSNIVKWTTHKAPINDQEFLVTNWTDKFKQH